MSKNDMSTQLLKQVLEEQKEQNKSLTKIEVSFAKMEANVEKNTEDLAYHIKRTDVLEQLHKDNQSRIEKLEQPLSVKDLAKKTSIVFGAFGAVLSACYAGLKILGIIN